MIRKKIGVLLALLLFTINSPLLREKAYASDAPLFFYPSSGIVEDVEEGFTVDVLIDSGGVEISKARVVVKYDPQVIILKEAGEIIASLHNFLTTRVVQIMSKVL